MAKELASAFGPSAPPRRQYESSAITALAAYAPYLAAFLVWMLSHPFEGVAGDGIIYISRAVADLDPDGLGKDMMFVHDGQSSFSLFRLLASFLTAELGPTNTTVVLAIVNSVTWLVAFAYLARQTFDRRIAWLATMFVAVLPLDYGAYHVLHAGEIFAVPRPLAEALVFLALAAVLQRRFALASGWFAGAAVLHPIMSLAGVAVAIIVIVDRVRWLALVLAVASAILLTCAYANVPVVDRLLMIVDPEWQTLLKIRHPYLYPTLWQPEMFGRTALSVATLSIAGRLTRGLPKRLLLATAIVGPLGILASALFGDVAAILLVEQIQLWRMEWLTSTLGAAALALCAVNLWPEGGLRRLTFLLLCFGWMFDSQSYAALITGLMSLVVYEVGERRKISLSARVEAGLLWGGMGLLLAFKLSQLLIVVSVLPPSGINLATIASVRLLSLPVIALALRMFLRERLGAEVSFLAAIAMMSAIACYLCWDVRSPYQRALQAQRHDADLTRILSAHPGEIFWPDGLEPWYLSGRPAWALQVQGAGGVFSRPLSMLFADRMRAAVDAGFMMPTVLRPFDQSSTYRPPVMSKAGVEKLCARPDAPAWIVMPLIDDAKPPADVVTHTWHGSAARDVPNLADGVLTWHVATSYALAACAEQIAHRS